MRISRPESSKYSRPENKTRRKNKAKKYDEVDMAQMSLFDTVKDDDVLEELKSMWMWEI